MALSLKAGNTVFVTAGELQEWFEKSKPGDLITYAVGTLTSRKSDSIELTAVARMARLWSEDGRVDLVQRRRGVDSYEYIAIRKNY